MNRAAVRLAFCAALALACAAPGVRAEMLTSLSSGGVGDDAKLMYSGSQLVQGTSADVTTLKLSGAGTLSFVLTDLQFPAAFESLSFAVTNASTRLTSMSGAGVLTLAVAGPTTLYADVFATTQGATNVGLYNLQVDFAPAAPVPLPASGALLALALVSCTGALWRRGRRTYNCNTCRGLIGA
jgi:hypothetical protein